VGYQGVVKEVTKDSITIQWPGEEKPKKFAVSETLAAGGFPTKSRPGSTQLVPYWYRYRLKDVEVGDIVYIHFARLGGVDICDQINISKRPGGRVPPLPPGAQNLRPIPELPIALFPPLIPYHERKNAYWDLVDKGIPYPEKFGKDRRFPEAPMPRELPPPGPRAAP
jgi:hypothetical protein